MAKAKTTKKTTKVEKPIVEKKVETSKKDVKEIVEEIKEKIEKQQSLTDDINLKGDNNITPEVKDGEGLVEEEIKEEPGFDIDLLKKFIKEIDGIYLGGQAHKTLDKIKKSL